MRLVRMTVRTALRALARNLAALGAHHARRRHRRRRGDRDGERRSGRRRRGAAADREPRHQRRDGRTRARRRPAACAPARGGATTLTVADAQAIENECPSVAAVAWVKRDVAQVVYGNQNWSTALQGSPPSFPSVRDWPVARGRFFTAVGGRTAPPRSRVLGQTLVDTLFAPGEDPLGATIRVKNVPFRVIGVLARKGQTSWGQDQDDVVIVPVHHRGAPRARHRDPRHGQHDPRLARRAPAASTTAVERDHRRCSARATASAEGEEDDFTVRSMTRDVRGVARWRAA